MKWSQTLASNTGLNLLQTLARILFALLVLLYFLHDAGLLLAPAVDWVLFAIYVVIHVGLLRWRSPSQRWVAGLIDLLAVSILVVFDPQVIPPTLLLFLILPVSTGARSGLKAFLLVLVAAVVAATIALSLHGTHLHIPIAGGSLFLAVTLLLCALYFLLLLLRNQVLARNARKAAWRHPDTRLLSQQALISTGGWLLPLHDRIAQSLTLALLEPVATQIPTALADLLENRIRRSDIAGHFDNKLALLLPATTADEAGNLLQELHDQQPIFRAAVITLADTDQALEPSLAHLDTTLTRTEKKDVHWLIHAAQPS